LLVSFAILSTLGIASGALKGIDYATERSYKVRGGADITVGGNPLRGRSQFPTLECMSNDQYQFTNPVTRYPKLQPEEQSQPAPGRESEMYPQPDLGADSYRGSERLSGRRALVTGADSGIGAAVAIAFAREGADVAISYLPSEEADAKEIVKLIESAGSKAVALPGDLADPEYCESLVRNAVDSLGGLDLLVNNAGKQVDVEDFEKITDEQFDRTFKTNVYGMFRVTQAAVPHMPPGSTIINTTSVQAYLPSPSLVDYASTKGTINTFTKALAGQLAGRGIRVNAVAPGPIWTALQVSGGQKPEKLPKFGQQTPLGRPGQPAELAPAYVFLASGESSFVVGETLNVNGGMPTP
jgi:NAD(P)-dependent dehydrogenase (short-subunit alcohol dehydrogenase family)